MLKYQPQLAPVIRFLRAAAMSRGQARDTRARKAEELYLPMRTVIRPDNAVSGGKIQEGG
ncbi:hypothetical protein D3C72_2543780 [compost metagenome]